MVFTDDFDFRCGNLFGPSFLAKIQFITHSFHSLHSELETEATPSDSQEIYI